MFALMESISAGAFTSAARVQEAELYVRDVFIF